MMRRANGGNWRIIGEFTEVESGKRSDRPALEKALAAARARRVPLVVTKVDRLTRSVPFLSRLLEAAVHRSVITEIPKCGRIAWIRKLATPP
jgi:DNA invertase Pin-like site-specific DNA recombinase